MRNYQPAGAVFIVCPGVSRSPTPVPLVHRPRWFFDPRRGHFSIGGLRESAIPSNGGSAKFQHLEMVAAMRRAESYSNRLTGDVRGGQAGTRFVRLMGASGWIGVASVGTLSLGAHTRPGESERDRNYSGS